MLSGRVLGAYELLESMKNITHSQLVNAVLNGIELLPAGPRDRNCTSGSTLGECCKEGDADD